MKKISPIPDLKNPSHDQTDTIIYFIPLEQILTNISKLQKFQEWLYSTTGF